MPDTIVQSNEAQAVVRSDLVAYRKSKSELVRTKSMLGLVAGQGETILDIGARDGHFSRLFADRFEHVTALDLDVPKIDDARIECVAGDVTALQFDDDSFDVVFCAEVLEHIPALDKACQELQRVARNTVVIGVPYQQDLRMSATLCRSCGKENPPWGHVNSFDLESLAARFDQCTVRESDLIWRAKGRTNGLAHWFLGQAGHPYGTYKQHEPCVHCGAELVPPPEPRSLGSRLCSRVGETLKTVHTRLAGERPSWLHVSFKVLDLGQTDVAGNGS